MIHINVEIDSEFISVDKNICREIVRTIFIEKDIHNTDITVIFGEDELLTTLKKEYFGKDQLTDVISFRLNDKSEQDIEGEIYISLTRAKENALQFEEPFEKEIARLIIHGSLHLIGYTDETLITKREMTRMENQYLHNRIWKNILPSKKELINEKE